MTAQRLNVRPYIGLFAYYIKKEDVFKVFIFYSIFIINFVLFFIIYIIKGESLKKGCINYGNK